MNKMGNRAQIHQQLLCSTNSKEGMSLQKKWGRRRGRGRERDTVIIHIYFLFCLSVTIQAESVCNRILQYITEYYFFSLHLLSPYPNLNKTFQNNEEISVIFAIVC